MLNHRLSLGLKKSVETRLLYCVHNVHSDTYGHNSEKLDELRNIARAENQLFKKHDNHTYRMSKGRLMTVHISNSQIKSTNSASLTSLTF